jgi:hypothetical protein
MYTALFAGRAEALTFEALPALFVASLVGFLCGDVILAWVVGTGVMRRLYLSHAVTIVRVVGGLFLAFAASTLWEAVPKLIARLA